MTTQEKELLRHAALEALAARQGIALTVAGIARRVRTEVDFKFTDEELRAELDFLMSLGFVGFDFDELGSTSYWKVTAKGVLHYERKQ